MSVSVCVLVRAPAYTVRVHARFFMNVHVHLQWQTRACVKNSDKISRVSDLFLCPGNFYFTMIANETERISLEATNVPVSKLTRSATHVSNNQATFQPLDSGNPSTLPSLSLSLSLSLPSSLSIFLSSSSSSLQPVHQSAQNSSLKHYTIRHSSFTLATP